MTDIVDSGRRSEMMSRIKGRDTVPEIVVRRIAHGLGFRFRLYRKDLPGRPDIVSHAIEPSSSYTAVSGTGTTAVGTPMSRNLESVSGRTSSART